MRLQVAAAGALQAVELAWQVGAQAVIPSLTQQPADVAGERMGKPALLFGGG